MNEITNWRGEPLATVRSRGGVLAMQDPWAGLMRGNVRPWPPVEIVQKLYQSRQIRAFDVDAAQALTSEGRYYCDLQSIHSEDSLTWNAFGTLAYEPPDTRGRFLRDVFERMDVQDLASFDHNSLWLWRRIPHPESLVPGGPEIDFGIQTETAVVLGEAKWRSDIGRGQGVDGNLDQMQLRRMIAERRRTAFFPGYRQFVLLLVGRIAEGVDTSEEIGDATIHIRHLAWTDVASIRSHPFSGELQKHVDWKTAHSQN